MKNLNFFIDIDGTLFGGGHKGISDGVISAILKAKEGGSRFFINTARPHWLVSEKEFPPEIFDGICSGCGTCISYHGKIIYENYLSDAEVKKAVNDLKKVFPPEFSILVEGKDMNYYCGATIQWFINAKFPKLENDDDIGTLYKDIKTQKLSFNKLSGEFKQEWFDCVRDSFDVMIHPAYAEIAPKGYSKGKAIEIAEKELSIDHSTTVAIGDSLNDAEMFRYAAVSVAMGNAPDSVKALCDHVTASVAEDGVAKAIEMLTSE